MLCDKIIKQLSAFLDGELTAQEKLAVRSHLDSCAGCRRELEELQQTVRAVSGLPRVPAPPGFCAKALSGLDGAEAEMREDRVPRWRMFWGAAAAILIAAVIMLLSMPANRARRSSAAGQAPQVAEAPPATQEQRRETAGPFMEAQRSEAENTVRLRPSAPLAGRSAPGAAGAAVTGGQVKADETVAMKAAAPAMASGVARAGPAMAVPVETVGEEIALPSANPEAAFARARALAEERGWLAPAAEYDGLSDSFKDERKVPKMVLRLKRSQIPLLKDALTKAGLVAPAEAQLGAKAGAAMETASVLRTSAAAGNREVLNNVQQQSPGKALSPYAAAAPANYPAVRKAPDGAFVRVVLAFPRAEGAARSVASPATERGATPPPAPGKSADVK